MHFKVLPDSNNKEIFWNRPNFPFYFVNVQITENPQQEILPEAL